MIRTFFTVLFLTLTCCVLAQTQTKDVLFNVDDEPVYASEFVRVFNKNLDLVKDESQKDVDEYLKLFVNYKLKLKEAKRLDLHKKPNYIRELSNYKKQLAKNYLTDTEVTNALIEEAYERVSNEVNANHILIRLDDTASPKDTLNVYNELLELRERLINEGFHAVKNDVHNGKTVFAEKLGYFSGFKMVYEFENAAFNTEEGEVSMPFRTQFGYHIVNVLGKRKSRGTVEVAHIMVVDKDKDTSNQNAVSRINEIYKKLEQGESFESLAKQFSEDKSSAGKGGRLNPFAGGELSSPEFEDQAFALNTEGEYTKPFRSNFGWHIVTLISKKEVAPFEEIKSEIENKVKRDSRSKLIKTSRVNELKKRYKIANAEEGLKYFVSILTEDYYKSTWKLPENFNENSVLTAIEDQEIAYKDFASFLVKSQRRQTKKQPFETLVNNQYEIFLNNSLLKYQEDNLEHENQEFASVLSEYRDGLLLFDLMDNEIWNAATNDSVGVQKFYQANKNNYFFNDRVDAVVASSATKKDIKKVAKMLKSGLSPDAIKTKMNTKDQIHVLFTIGIMDKDHQALPKDIAFKKGVSKIVRHNDTYVVVRINEVKPKTLKSFDEAKGKVISDFQDHKEKTWLKSLKEKYKVTVNQKVLDSVREQLNN